MTLDCELAELKISLLHANVTHQRPINTCIHSLTGIGQSVSNLGLDDFVVCILQQCCFGPPAVVEHVAELGTACVSGAQTLLNRHRWIES